MGPRLLVPGAVVALLAAAPAGAVAGGRAIDVRVAPRTIVSGAPAQHLRVVLAFRRSLGRESRLLVRLRRPAQEPSADNRRGITAVVTARTRIDARTARAGSRRVVVFRNLNPPPGSYRLEVIRLGRRHGARLSAVPVRVLAQNRRPPGATDGILSGGGVTAHA